MHLPRTENEDELNGPSSALKYANDIMRRAERNGYQNDHQILDVIRKLEADKRGEPFGDEEPYLFNRSWK
jgi:hypothetical protein